MSKIAAEFIRTTITDWRRAPQAFAAAEGKLKRWPGRGRARRFASVSLLALAISAFGALSGPVMAASPESNEYYQKAEEALKNGKVSEAIIHLKNAVRADPGNADARFLLGQYHLQSGDIPGAEKEFREARKLGLGDEKVLPLLAQAYIMQRKSDELLAEITTDKLTGETKVLAHTFRARAYIIKEDLAKAHEEMDLARPDAGKVAAFYAADAELMQREGDLLAAEKAIDQAIAINPKSSHAYWLKGELRRTQKDLAGALDAYNKGLAEDKESGQLLISRAFALLGLARYEEANADAEAILKRAPEMPMALYVKSAVLAQKGETEKALDVLQPAEFRLSSFMPAVYLMASSNLKLDRLEGALNYAKRYYVANPDRPDAIKLLSAVYFKQKRYADAIKLLEPHEQDEAVAQDITFLQLLGNTYLASRNYPAASRVFKTLQKLNPDDQKVREQLAVISLGMGEKEEAIRELEALSQGENDSERVNLLLIVTHLRNKEYDKAHTAALNYVKERADSAVAHNLLGSVLVAKQQIDEARAAFEAALKVQPDFTPAILNLTQLDIAANKREDAKKRLMAVIEAGKSDEKVLTQLAAIAAAEKDTEGTLAWLQQAVEKNPKSETARLRLINQLLQMKKNEAAMQAAADLNAIAPESPMSLNALAQVQILNKQYGNGIATYRRLVAVAPDSVDARVNLGKALVLNGNLIEAKTAFDDAIRLAPDQLDPRGQRLAVEIKDAGMAAAERLAMEYRDAMPGNANNRLLLGDLYLRGEKYALAIPEFEKALELKPEGSVLQRLYIAMLRGGNEEGAFKKLRSWTNENPDDWETRMMLATELIRRGDADAAISENETLNEMFPGRPVILNNLGWLYFRKGDPRGVELVRTAYELAPRVPEIQDTYGWLLVKEGKITEGLNVLRQAADALPKSAEVQYHFAAALAQNGKQSEALEILTRALAGKEPFEERKDAEALLQSLKAG